MDKDKAIRSAKLTAAGILDKARARTAVTRAGGQIAPSKYLPDVPRQVHADGGRENGNDDGITAYHGSPHDFDQFDISKLGTGEGNQSYGHGLYFAGNEKIAKHYRDTLTKSNPYTAGQYYDVDGKTIRYPWNGGTYDPRALAAKMIDDANGDTNLASKRALDVHSSGDTTQNWLGVAEEAKKNK